MIQLQSISLQRGTKFLLEDADLTIYPGQKLGLIGANGSGKTSLFKLLLGELHEEAGQCTIPKQWSLAHMAQEVAESDRKAIDHVIDGDEELRRLEEAMATASGEKLGHLFERLEEIDGYTATARAEKLLSGLGFSSADGQRAASEFSGGWRIRLNLARALMCRSDLLLLDEPTNHLDLDACVWLESWLRDYRGTMLVISHDRDFLDNVVDGIVHIDQRHLETYSGNYSSFELQRAERQAQQQQAHAKQQQRIAHIESFVRRFKAKASKAKQAQSRVKELERMQLVAPAHMDSPFTFTFPEPDKLPQTLVTLTEAALGYDAPLLENIELTILNSSRLGLLGHNGAGKSTLMKTLAGLRPALAGERIEATHLKIGYYSQHQLETLDFQASCLLHLQRMSPKATEQEMRNFLGSFGFIGDRVFEEIAHFSGGEKARLALAILAWQKPNILLMDEPTNHLDLEVRHALTVALQSYEGAVVIVSHDRHLLRNTVDQFLLVADGKVDTFDGDLNDYEDWLKKERDQQNQNKKTAKPAQRSASIALSSTEQKALAKEVKKLEKNLATLQGKLAELDTTLADTSLYDKEQHERLQELLQEQKRLRQEVDQCEEAWLAKSEALEAM